MSKEVFLWAIILAGITTIAFVLMASAWGLAWGAICTVLLLLCGACWVDWS